MNIQPRIALYREVGRSLSFCIIFSLLLTAGQAQAQVFINFDTDAFGNPISAPPLFSGANPLRDTYAALGVHFEGPSANDGGAILDVAEGARSGSNALAFNMDATLANGGRARDPEGIVFDQDISEVSIFASGGLFDTTFILTAFNAAGDVLSDTEVFSNDGAYVQLSLAGTGIRRVELAHEYAVTPPQQFFVYDDLTFRPAAVPAPGSLLVATLGLSMTGLACRRRGREKSAG
jgi:hypothetical protein